MIHPEVAHETLSSIAMAIADLGTCIGDTAVLAPEADQRPRLRLLGRMAEDIVLLVRAGEAVIPNTANAAP
jgi:hypothetical protein